MANLTLAIDEEVLKEARKRAIDEGTTVNAKVREYLESYAAAHDEQRRAVERFLQVAQRQKSGSGSAERTWSRDSIYDDAIS